MILFKRTAWDIFGGQSSIKHAVASEMPGQMCLDFDTGNVKKDVRPGVYTVYDIAKYIYSRYKDRGEVTWDGMCIFIAHSWHTEAIVSLKKVNRR